MPQGVDDRAALDAAIAGEPRASEDVAVRAARARMGLEAMPSLEAIAKASSPLAAALFARHAVAGLDAPALASAAALAVSLARDEREHIEAELAQAWSKHFEGKPTFEMARALEVRAARLRIPHAVIDAASLVASAALIEQSHELATTQARRASRMARTEGLPCEEYLAHLVLARARRHLGRPHLSARIVTAIARVAPARWRGWLAIELRLSGAADMATRVLARGSDGALDHTAVDALLRSSPFAEDAWRTVAPLDVELRALHAAIDPNVAAPPSVAPFLMGQIHDLPGTLSGMSAEGKGIRVIAAPNGVARRVLWTDALVARGVIELGQRDGAKQHRREAALAQLAFAGEEGLANDELFRRVWGFQFTPHLHQGVLDVLLHRVRAALGDVGELVRKDKLTRLVLMRSVALVDPRIEASLEDAVLRALALRGEARARELADDLGVPLRTVQQALSRLVEGEECHRVGEGQAISYRVEDTTFREPTRI
jgi:hypothetical protein